MAYQSEGFAISPSDAANTAYSASHGHPESSQYLTSNTQLLRRDSSQVVHKAFPSLSAPSTGAFNKPISCDPAKSFSHTWCSFPPPSIPSCLLLPHLHACSPCPQCSPGPFAIIFMFSIQSLPVLFSPIPTPYGDLRATAQTGQDRFGSGGVIRDQSRLDP